jgi:TetR/AcrR family transcriptional regulator of autoinduction and epiphytic fitness
VRQFLRGASPEGVIPTPTPKTTARGSKASASKAAASKATASKAAASKASASKATASKASAAKARPTKAAAAATSKPAAPDAAQADGRRLRAERNRDAVVQAVLQIIKSQGGGPVPGAAEVAVRAKVSERTVFRHFADLDSLFLAAAAHQRPIHTTYLAPRPDAAEVDKRIVALVKLRSRLYEEIAPVRRFAVRVVAGNKTLADSIGESNQAARYQIADTFAAELARAGRSRASVLDELDLILSWAVWDTLRSDHSYSADKARKLIGEMITGVLVPLAPAPSKRR